jgi:hypothetical protein
MFRKIGNIATMCLLLTSTTGFAVSEHFCGTRLVSIEINKEAEPCCDNGMCCHTEVHFYQLEEVFVATQLNIGFSSTMLSEFTIPVLYTLGHIFEADIENHFSRIAESPPPPDRSTRLSYLQKYIL